MSNRDNEIKKAGAASDDCLKLLYAFPVYTKAGSHYARHAHAFHELVYVQSGRFHSKAPGFEQTAVPGDILLYMAQTEHEEWTEGETDVATLACTFEYGGFQPNEPILRKDISGNVQKLLTDLSSLHIFNAINKGIEHNCLPTLQALLHELERLKPNSYQFMVDKTRAYIRAHLAESLTVEELAQHAGLTRSHFALLYRSATGLTPRNDIQRIRIEEAKQLITTTSLPLHKIAPQVGICNEYHLSRLIKSILGVGVRDLRKSRE